MILQPRAAERATLSQVQLPELCGINRVFPGLELDAEGSRDLFMKMEIPRDYFMQELA